VEKSETQQQVPAGRVFQMLSEFFGDNEQAVRMMQAFAGVTLRFPTADAVEKVSREVQIARVLNRNMDTAAVKRLALLHGSDTRQVAKSFARRTGGGLKEARRRAECPKRCQRRFRSR
jgi:hypothetical protein